MTGPLEPGGVVGAAASAWAATEGIRAGDWDRYLAQLRLAIDARMRTPDYLHVRVSQITQEDRNKNG